MSHETEWVDAFFEAMNQRDKNGLRAFYHVGGRGSRARWVRPRAMSLKQIRRTLALLTAAGKTDEASCLAGYARQKVGPNVILTRQDALEVMAKALGVPVTELLE